MQLQDANIMVVDDQPVVRQGLVLLVQAFGATVCGDADGSEDALKQLDSAKPDLVLTDLSMPGPNGIQLTRAVRGRRPTLPVLMLSSFSESLFASQAIEAGASGYLMKDAAPEALQKAMQTVLDGGLYLSPSIWEDLSVDVDVSGLTPAQSSLFQQLGRYNPSYKTLAPKLEWTVAEVRSGLTQLLAALRLPSEVSLRVTAARAQQPDV